MHAQSTFRNYPSTPNSYAAASVMRRQAEARFWLLVYAILASLIVLALSAAIYLFWWDGYSPVSVLRSSAPLSVQPSSNLPVNSPDVIHDFEQAAAVSPTAEPTQVEVAAQPTQEVTLITEAVSAQPTQAEPVLEAAPVVEPAATAEPLEESTHRQVYLGLEDDYHSQLSIPNGQSACGPTALLIALDYYDLQSSLQDMVDQSTFDPQAGGYDPTCTSNAVCMSPQALVKVASEQYGLDVQYGEGWSFDQVYDALKSGSPVIADIAWDPGNTTLGHFVVIYGIDADNQVVYYHDPYSGAGLSATWDDFSYLWSQTVDVGDPLQGGGYKQWGMAIYMR